MMWTMCKCNCCGGFFDVEDRSVYREDYGEYFSCCPNCGGDYGEVYVCDSCGAELVFDDDIAEYVCSQCGEVK